MHPLLTGRLASTPVWSQEHQQACYLEWAISMVALQILGLICSKQCYVTVTSMGGSAHLTVLSCNPPDQHLYQKLSTRLPIKTGLLNGSFMLMSCEVQTPATDGRKPPPRSVWATAPLLHFTGCSQLVWRVWNKVSVGDLYMSCPL
jgi:hypothetical protein